MRPSKMRPAPATVPSSKSSLPELSVSSPIERAIIELASASFDPETLSNVARCLGRLGHRIDGHSPKNADVVPLLRSLAARGLLTAENPCAVAPELAHRVMLEVAREGRLGRIAEALRDVRPARSAPGGPIATWGLVRRELRFELYAEQWESALSLARSAHEAIFRELCSPFDAKWVARFPAELRRRALKTVLESSLELLEPAKEAFTLFEREADLNDSEHRVLVEQLLFRGRLEEAEKRLQGRASLEAEVSRAFALFLRGRFAEAIAVYEPALQALFKRAGKGAGFFPDRAGLFFVIALLAEGSPASLKRVDALLGVALRSKKLSFEKTYRRLSELVGILTGRKEHEELLYLASDFDLGDIPTLGGSLGPSDQDPIEILIHAAAILWAKVRKNQRSAKVRSHLKKRLASAKAAGYHWYAAQAASVLADYSGDGEDGGDTRPPPGEVSLARLVSPRERWSEALEALLEAAAPKAGKKSASKTSGPASDRRMIWLLRTRPWELEPREQTYSKGSWSKGRPVALKRLHEEARTFSFLSDVDRAVCATIQTETSYEYYGRYARTSYSLDLERALLALAGSDTVLMEGPKETYVPCEIRPTAPRLEVARKGAHLALSLEPAPRNETDTLFSRMAGAHTVEIVEFAPIHHAIARILGKKPLAVPRDGEERLRTVLGALSGRVVVHSDLSGEGGGEEAEAVRGETRPCLLLRALGEGLSVAAHVRPLGKDGPLVRPGRGGKTLLAQVSGQPACAARDLAEEMRRFEDALAACPTLAGARSAEMDFVLRDREDALTALLELRALDARGLEVSIEWPEGEHLRVGSPVGLEELELSIASESGGFLARGALTLPGRASLELAELLDYLSASPGRFLRLAGEEQYLALTAELRAKLDEMANLGERSKKGLRLHPLTAPLVANLFDSARVEADARWRQQVERFTASEVEPELPSTLRAELRPYQLEGFRWLTRLARWGAGGCLADDMGLGKTLQTIALLLHRAAEGPALVVAPTSVVPTWIDEVERFAPTLRVRAFMGPAPSRLKELENLAPFDLVVTSYALLHSDIDALEKLELATVVLDEAQAIKNVETKRAQAASRLRAPLRLVTTGTPIENRLEDLFSLFSFLNPGLLGSAQSFQARYVRPVEQTHSSAARDQLRKLVAPFILRRTKTQVLPELPARTETTLRIPLELEEMSLYEAVREKALAELERQAGGTGGRGTGRIRILAALTKLRLAASNARLVLPESKAASAKLAALGELLDELLPNQHKVLVFSQFVSHLALVRELLDAREVSYQYLDGETPLSARKAAVEAFQKGQGDVFLISLKAGGFGLNLTAADYVVHMDPWWNPAVEDQASDRVHRIGQSRPVTIYRLVARDTIEDRILALHHRKRELADGILEGSDLSGRMSETELLDLIRGR